MALLVHPECILSLALIVSLTGSLPAQDAVFTDETETRLPVIEDASNDADFADVDRDGNLDVYVAMEFWDNYLLLNDGSGNFTDESYDRLPRTINPWANMWATFVDVDTDMDLDNIVANWSGERNWLDLNDGLGFFTAARSSQFPSGKAYSYQAIAADVDGDFDADAFIADHDRGWRRPRIGINPEGLFPIAELPEPVQPVVDDPV